MFIIQLIVLVLVLCAKYAATARCPYPSSHEVTFNIIVSSLFRDNQIPPGDVLDVGAHNGTWGCMYACFDQSRTVHAIDPNPKLVDAMECTHHNFKPHNAAVSNRNGFMRFETRDFVGKVERIGDKRQHENDIPIQTLDYLFLNLWKATPGFLHIDVEGYELEALQGATKIIRKFQPVFSIEAHVNENKTFTVELLKFVEGFGYSLFMVNEVCGGRQSCRNFLCFPRVVHHLRKEMMHPVLDLAHRTGMILKVTKDNVFDEFEKSKHLAPKWGDAGVFPAIGMY